MAAVTGIVASPLQCNWCAKLAKTGAASGPPLSHYLRGCSHGGPDPLSNLP